MMFDNFVKFVLGFEDHSFWRDASALLALNSLVL